MRNKRCSNKILDILTYIKVTEIRDAAAVHLQRAKNDISRARGEGQRKIFDAFMFCDRINIA